MLIISQNGEVMLQMERYAITADQVAPGEVKVTASDADMDYLLGTYQNMEAAKKAMEKLQKAYVRYRVMNVWIGWQCKLSREDIEAQMVYRMP